MSGGEGTGRREAVHPTRREVAALIDGLRDTPTSREAAARWAADRLRHEQPDAAVEEALDVIVLLDAPQWTADARGATQRTGYLVDLDQLREVRSRLDVADPGRR